MHRARSVRAQAIAVLVFGASFASLAMSACGSRGPLDDEPYPDASGDVVTADVEVEAASDGAADANRDAGREAGGFVACGVCLFDQCSQPILNCVQSPPCQAVFQCVVTTCLGSGGLNPSCLFQCGQGDLSGALQALTVFQCVTGKCGPDCTSVLGLLGGLGGGGSSSGGSSSGGSSSGGSSSGGSSSGAVGDGGISDSGVKNAKNAAFKSAFSRWPELVSRLPED